MTESFPTAYWNLIIGVVGILLLLVITITNGHWLSNVHSSSQSIVTQNLGVSLLTSSLPLLLDAGINLSRSNNSSKSQQLLVGRAFYAIATFLLGLNLAAQYDIFQIFSSYEESYWFMLNSYRLAQMCSIAFFVSVTDHSGDSDFRAILISTLALMAVCFNSLNWEVVPGIKNISYCLYLVSMVIYVIQENVQIWKNKRAHLHSLYLNIFFITFLFGFVIRIYIFIFLSTTKGALFFESSLSVVIFIYIIYSTALGVIPNLFAHHDNMAYKDQIIATKTAYERYISHELRSPLNAAHMGIQFSITKIPENTTNVEMKEIRDTLIEARAACDDGLVILDDLLMYDKFENGLAKMHKEDCNVRNFMLEYLSMFKVQIRAKNINLEMINCDVDIKDFVMSDDISALVKDASNTTNNTFAFKRISLRNNSKYSHTVTCGECVEDDDELFADKSKLGQVIRNLMCNAIKFTPKKGNIKVCMKFITNEEVTPPNVTISQLGCFKTYVSKIYNYMKSFIIPHKSIIENKYIAMETSADTVSTKLQSSSHKSIESTSTSTSASTHSKQTSPIKRRKSIGNIKKSVDTINITDQKLQLEFTPNERQYNSSQSGMLVIEVQDSGPGISIENQSRLFKEIVQFNPEKLQAGGGSGLGLWISKNIVDLHGGQLSVHSEGGGKGTTFRLEIPMTRRIRPKGPSHVKTVSSKQDINSSRSSSSEILLNSLVTMQSSDYTSTAHSHGPSDAKSSRTLAVESDAGDKVLNVKPMTDNDPVTVSNVKKKRLLLVDDVGTNRKFLRKLLEQRGHSCEESEDGAEALQMVKDATDINYYDVIFMDFVMPNMNGPESTKAIRELGYIGPIIGVTGNAHNDDKVIFMNAGVTNVILKPLKMEKLLTIIDL